MATEQLLLSAVVSGSDNWTLAAGSTKVIACQTPDDDDTTYISGTLGQIQLFELANPVDIQAGDTINSVYLRVRNKRLGTPGPYLQARLVTSGGTLNSGSIQTGASWADISETFTEKPGGGAWNLTALNELQAGIEHISGNREGGCTTIEVLVDYTTGAPPTDDLVATDVTTGAPSLGTPTIEQIHALTSIDLSAGAPTLATAELGQDHILEAVAITTSAPTLGAPTLAEAAENVDNLVATDIVTGASTLGTPSISQIHALETAGITISSPALDSPTIGQTHELSATDIFASAPVIGAPTLGETAVGTDSLVALDIFIATPVIYNPRIEVSKSNQRVMRGRYKKIPMLSSSSLIKDTVPGYRRRIIHIRGIDDE